MIHELPIPRNSIHSAISLVKIIPKGVWEFILPKKMKDSESITETGIFEDWKYY